MNVRNFNGIWIPKEIWLSKKLSLQEKVFLVEIDNLEKMNGCFEENSYFAQFFGISNTRVSQVINGLKNKGYIDVEFRKAEKSGKQIIVRIIKINKSAVSMGKNNNEFSNNFIFDEDLSLKSKGLLAILLSEPDNFEFSLSNIISACKEGEAAVRSALKELKKRGYVKIVRQKSEDNGQFDYRYEIHETSQTFTGRD